MELVFLIGIIVLAFAIGMQNAARRVEKLCTVCGTVDRPASRSTASVGIGLLMWGGGLALAFFVHWLFLLLPVGHVIARLATPDVDVCAKCGSNQLVPLDTPAAQEWTKRRADHADARSSAKSTDEPGASSL